jgi:hypothetical protein
MCVSAASVALLGGRWDDVKWVISVFVSMFGTIAALWMFHTARRDRLAEKPNDGGRPFRFSTPRVDPLDHRR